MSAWWSKVGDVIERHDGLRPKFAAAIRVNFAVNGGGAKVEDCGLYRRDPAKHPDEPNVLPGEIAKAQRKKMVEQIRGLMRKR